MTGSSRDDQWGWHLSSQPSSSRKRSAPTPPPKAAPPLRVDAPERKERKRGALPHGLGEEERTEALRHFNEEMFAPTTRYVMNQKMKTITAALGMWGHAHLPPTIDHIISLGATLKRGNYRSASSYLTLYKGHAERAGHELSGTLQRAIRYAIRSCDRGLGGPRKSSPSPV